MTVVVVVVVVVVVACCGCTLLLLTVVTVVLLCADDAHNRPLAYKFWRFHCTKVYNGGTYIQIAELNFQTCGSDKTSSDHNMASNAPVVIDLDKQDVLSFVTTASNGGNAAVHLEVMSGSTSWAYTEAWKCK